MARTKTAKLQLRLTSRQLEQIDDLADYEGHKTRSEWARQTIIDAIRAGRRRRARLEAPTRR